MALSYVALEQRYVALRRVPWLTCRRRNESIAGKHPRPRLASINESAEGEVAAWSLDFLAMLAYSFSAMAVQQGGSRTPFRTLIAQASRAARAIFAFASRRAGKLGAEGIVILASCVVIAVYITFVVYLWRQEFFEIRDTEAGVEVLAAALP